jgi:hypothetical protein
MIWFLVFWLCTCMLKVFFKNSSCALSSKSSFLFTWMNPIRKQWDWELTRGRICWSHNDNGVGNVCIVTSADEFYDTNGIIRMCKSKKNRQHNGQKKKDKMTNNDLQIKSTHKTKDWVTRTPLKTGGELRCSRRVINSCKRTNNDMQTTTYKTKDHNKVLHVRICFQCEWHYPITRHSSASICIESFSRST